MKTFILLILTLITCNLHAEIFTPARVKGTAGGAILGGVIGHQSGETKNGALLGAGVGLLAALAVENRAAVPTCDNHHVCHEPIPADVKPQIGITTVRPHTGKINGAVLGAIAGGVIGHNQDKKAKGIAIGAGSGFVVGTLYDRIRSQRVAKAPRISNTAKSTSLSLRDARSPDQLRRIFGDQAGALQATR